MSIKVVVGNKATQTFRTTNNSIGVVTRNNPSTGINTAQDLTKLRLSSNVGITIGLKTPDFFIADREETEMAYAKQFDFVGDDAIYKGESTAGSLSSSASWRIQKITVVSDEDIRVEFADGNNNFDKIWDNRLTYSYS